jgi:surface antigen
MKSKQEKWIDGWFVFSFLNYSVSNVLVIWRRMKHGMVIMNDEHRNGLAYLRQYPCNLLEVE